MKTFELRLNEKPFNQIRFGTKRLELRLNDNKRQQYSVGDILIFKKRSAELEKISTQIVNLHKFPSFKELYENFDKSIMGYLPNEAANYKDMEEYYSIDEQLKNGVVGIEIKLING